MQRQLRDLKENYTTLQQKETEVNAKKNEYEKKLELGKMRYYTPYPFYTDSNNISSIFRVLIILFLLYISIVFNTAEAETVTARNDLKLALKRVEDLQQAINGELDSELDSLNRYFHINIVLNISHMSYP